MKTGTTNSDAVGTLIHYFVTPVANLKANDADMKVIYGFPLNVWPATLAGTEAVTNDGTYALSTGLKIFISATATDNPLADYYGFYIM
jgi:hypothetical protein